MLLATSVVYSRKNSRMMSATLMDGDEDGRTALCSTAMLRTAELQGDCRYKNRKNNQLATVKSFFQTFCGWAAALSLDAVKPMMIVHLTIRNTELTVDKFNCARKMHKIFVLLPSQS